MIDKHFTNQDKVNEVKDGTRAEIGDIIKENDIKLKEIEIKFKNIEGNLKNDISDTIYKLRTHGDDGERTISDALKQSSSTFVGFGGRENVIGG